MRYPEEFKIQAVKQVTEKGKPVADVAQRLGMSVHSLYAWIKVYSKPQEQRQQDDDQQAELRKLRAELKLVGYMSASLAQQDIGRFLMQRYNWQRPHQFNSGLAAAVAEEKLNAVSGIS